MASGAAWTDLKQRLLSAAVMVAVGALAVVMGGAVFHLLAAAIVACMTWELLRMLDPGKPGNALSLAGLTGVISLVVVFVPGSVALPLLIAPGMVAFGLVTQRKPVAAVFTVGFLLAGYGLDRLRDDHGAVWLLWLVGVVVATDVLGYFAGRMIGGPKFWPRVSPKKTWSGTAAGWVAAGLVGVLFMLSLGTGAGLIGISIALSMASQLGDIAESALKRAVGVKDASALIPGHGGVMDRFDGMIGAALFLAIVQSFVVFPPGAVTG